MNQAQLVTLVFLIFFIALYLRKLQSKARLRRWSKNFSIDSVDIDTLDWNSVSLPNPDQERIWTTQDFCSIMIQYSPVPTEYPLVSTLQEFYSAISRRFDGSVRMLIEVGILQIDTIEMPYYIFKIPMKPTGMEYWCEIVFPFKEFGLKIMIFSPEQGITGIREVVLLDKRIAVDERTRKNFADGKLPENWRPDDPQFDREFPDHPVSKVRQWLKHIQSNTRIIDSVKEIPRYQVPKF
ncbi:hypothetical protein [Methylobacterium mesophilicum]